MPASHEPASLAPHAPQFAFYWYNFMPLARGTAAVGYSTVLGLFWAAGMPVTAHIPKDYQVRCHGWEGFDWSRPLPRRGWRLGPPVQEASPGARTRMPSPVASARVCRLVSSSSRAPQVDWEAILSQHPDAFSARLAQWMLPDAVREALGGPAAAGGAAAGAAAAEDAPASPRSAGASPAASPRGSSGGGRGGGAARGRPELPPLSDLPRCGEVLGTMRRRVEALNGQAAPRVQL